MSAILAMPSRQDNLRRRLVEQALSPDLLLGMPHLTPAGLSETWLMKELAHRHWLLLGQQLGLPDADFRSADGGEVYAAICASALRDAEFKAARANDVLTIATTMAPAGTAHMASVHHLSIHGRPVGQVELISTFVHRLQEGRNGSVARIRMPLQEAGQVRPHALVETARSLRRGDLPPLGGFSLEPVSPLREYVFQPSQSQDFNGAGLFYFANFVSACDRALASWSADAQIHVASREAYYVGNIEPGEPVRAQLRGLSDDHKGLHMILVRQDQTVIFHQVVRLHQGCQALRYAFQAQTRAPAQPISSAAGDSRPLPH